MSNDELVFACMNRNWNLQDRIMRDDSSSCSSSSTIASLTMMAMPSMPNSP